jgi:hypothetical protein
MQLADQEARRWKHDSIGTEHLLLGLVQEGNGVAANVLKNLDVDLDKIRSEVEKLISSGPAAVTRRRLAQTPRAKKVIEYSMEEARGLNHNYIGTEHLLLGLVREQEGIAAQTLLKLGLNLQGVREEVLSLLRHGIEAVDTPQADDERRAIEGYLQEQEREWKELRERLATERREAIWRSANRGAIGGACLLGGIRTILLIYDLVASALTSSPASSVTNLWGNLGTIGGEIVVGAALGATLGATLITAMFFVERRFGFAIFFPPADANSEEVRPDAD